MIDRERELEFLLGRVTSGRPELIIMWGRRRLGKTTLLRALRERSRAVYFLATRAPASEQLRRLTAVLAESFDDPLLRSTVLPSWGDALLYVHRHARERFVLIVDEFPYLVDADPAIASRFQLAWDQNLGTNSAVMLVLNGSSVSMMEEQALDSRSPLYGRRTGQWRLEPFGLQDLNRFFPRRTMADLVELHSVAGGVPYYLLQLDPGASLERNIKRRILSKGEVLYQEVPFLLREELREPRSYFPILAAIASGSRKFGEISSKTGFDKANLGKYLGTLQELQLVRREVPVTEVNPAKSRRGLYVIDDPFTSFWLRYVWPYLAELEMERVDEVWETRIAPDFPGYVAAHAERVLTTTLFREPVLSRLGFTPAHVGRHWDPEAELDIVALDGSRRKVALCEVKWSGRPVGTDIAADLRARGELVPELAACQKSYVIFSRSGFTPALSRSAPPDLVLVDLRDSPVM
jgi:AAA+ ATPase superfamily predicted ATPase